MKAIGSLSAAEQLKIVEILHACQQTHSNSAKELRGVFYSVKDKVDCGCVFFDGKKIVDVNAKWSEMCGYQRAEAVGKTMKILHGPKTASDELDTFHSQLANRENCHALLVNYDKQKQKMNNSINVWPVGKKYFVSFNVCVRGSETPNKSLSLHKETKSQLSMTELRLEVKNMNSYNRVSLNPSELTTRTCTCSYFTSDFFWHLLFYCTGPLSLVIILPICGHGFAVRHGFLPWYFRNVGLFPLSIITEWCTFFFVALIVYKSWVGRSMPSEERADRYFKCFPNPDLDMGMPLTFVLLRLLVISAKYAHLNNQGRQELFSPITHANFMSFMSKTLLGAWSGPSFNPAVMEHVVELEIDEADNLRGMTFSLIKHNQGEDREEGGGEEKNESKGTNEPFVHMVNPMARHEHKHLKHKQRVVQLTTKDTRAAKVTKGPAQKKKKRERRCSFISSVDALDKCVIPGSSAKCQVVDVDVADALMAICLESGHAIHKGMLGVLINFFIPGYITLILFIKWYFSTLPLQLHDQMLASSTPNASNISTPSADPFVSPITGFTLPVGCDATDHTLQVLSLIVGSLATNSLIMFGSVFATDMRRRKWQVKRYGDIIKFLVLRKSTDVLTWLRGRRVLVLIGRVYDSRITITLLILVGLIVFMVIWSFHSVSHISVVPQSFYVMTMLSWIIQFIIVIGTREGAMANRLPKYDTLAWGKIRANVCEHLDYLRDGEKREKRGKRDKSRRQHTKSVTSLEEAVLEGKQYRHNHLPDDVETLKVLDNSISAVADELKMTGDVGALKINSLVLTFQLYHTEIIIVQALMYLFLHTMGLMRLNGVPK